MAPLRSRMVRPTTASLTRTSLPTVVVPSFEPTAPSMARTRSRTLTSPRPKTANPKGDLGTPAPNAGPTLRRRQPPPPPPSPLVASPHPPASALPANLRGCQTRRRSCTAEPTGVQLPPPWRSASPPPRKRSAPRRAPGSRPTCRATPRPETPICAARRDFDLAWQRTHVRRRLGRHLVAEGVRRPRRVADGAAHLVRGVRARRRARRHDAASSA